MNQPKIKSRLVQYKTVVKLRIMDIRLLIYWLRNFFNNAGTIQYKLLGYHSVLHSHYGLHYNFHDEVDDYVKKTV